MVRGILGLAASGLHGSIFGIHRISLNANKRDVRERVEACMQSDGMHYVHMCLAINLRTEFRIPLTNSSLDDRLPKPQSPKRKVLLSLEENLRARFASGEPGGSSHHGSRYHSVSARTSGWLSSKIPPRTLQSHHTAGFIIFHLAHTIPKIISDRASDSRSYGHRYRDRYPVFIPIRVSCTSAWNS